MLLIIVTCLQFAATACTIVSGAIAERTRFEAYILYSFFMSAWVYPVLIHSIWSSSGWASAFRCAAFAALHACMTRLSLAILICAALLVMPGTTGLQQGLTCAQQMLHETAVLSS